MDDKAAKIIQDITPEQKAIIEAQLMYFFPLWLGEKRKRKVIEELSKEDTDFIMQVILLPTVSEERKAYLIKESEYKIIEELLKQVLAGNDDLLKEVKQIYENNVKRVKESYEEKIWDFKLRKLPKTKRKQAENMIAHGLKEKAYIVINNHYKSNPSIIEELDKYYNAFIDSTKRRNFDVFFSKALSINPELIPQIANIVYDPSYLAAPELDRVLSNKSEIPSRWYLYRKMTLSEYREFSEKIDDVKIWSKQFSFAVKSIRENIEVPILPIIKRKTLFNEILVNIQEKRFSSAMIVIFSVIEGLLWELSAEVNKTEKVYLSQGVIYDYVNNKDFESIRIRDILERSAVRKYLDEKFLHEFCNELYEERNPVLHGNTICFSECEDNALCFIKKIFSLDYIIETIIDVYKRNLFNEWDKGFTQERIDEYLKLRTK